MPGTLTCAYHGWTFDTDGTLVAVLSERPDCPLVGSVGQQTYPLRENSGFVWIWMGEGQPVPLEQPGGVRLNEPSIHGVEHDANHEV